ncbi:MAG: acyltransferase family protein [Marinicellaceae bacterium]
MQQRKIELDWLRVIVFGILIFYHIGMLYVADWGYHFKSKYSSEFLQNIMLLVNRWRLSILFLISGIAIRYYLQKVSLLKFAGMRTIRLLIPLAFAILVIIPPQLYVEMIDKGDLIQTSYIDFYKAFFDLEHPMFENYQSGVLPHMDVNHLWYIRELWWFSIYVIILSPLLNSQFVQSLVDFLGQKDSPFRLLFLPVLILSVLAFFVFPSDSEGYRIVMGFSFLIVGYLLGWNQNLWNLIKLHRRLFLYCAIGTYLLLIAYYQLVLKQREVAITGLPLFLEALFSYFNRWSWILMILGYGSQYLSKTNKYISYLNQGVYPYYILHQSVLIVLAFWLSDYALGGFFEPLFVIFGTIIVCAIGFEIIRHFKVLRLLFGLKIK